MASVSSEGYKILSFGSVLSEVSRAPLASADRKVAVCRAVEVAMLGPAALSNGASLQQPREDAIESMEQVFQVVGVLMGAGGRVDVVKAKSWLKEQGDTGVATAKLIGKLSSVRNAHAHAIGLQIMGLLQALASVGTVGKQLDEHG